ncbi:putative transcription factor C2H2 family [Lupinus albus]|uniref:Putative transcription factor C2H2 family n=1 Tax=Lupinus albus TaxID=3870 RepID=A0A6A4QEU9_LUPAL|nr:putative transcription factor C2H2 family [Lupinus albus]
MSHYGENHYMFRDLCLCGKASLEFIYSTWDCSPTFASSQKAETDFTMDLAPCYIKTEGKDSIMSIEDPCNSEKKTTHKLQVQVTAEEYGAKEKSSIFTYSSRDILSPEIASIIRLKERSVFFNYRYFDNKLIKTEVTNDFSCPVCLVRCGSYKGIKYHMQSSHDYFDYEFLADQVINVSIKPEVLEVITSGPKNCFSLLKIVGDLNPRQVFILRNARLCKRQFYHSVKYQPMSLEKVISDDDSEGEIDEETKDIEHRKLTEKCEGVTKEEKEIMFLWSSFIRRQRVLSDCHIPWACKTFTTLHSNVLVQSFELNLCWRMLMIKLWKHNLIDGEVMNDCSVILEKYLKQNSDSPT